MLCNGASVKINAPVDRTLLANFDKISSIAKRWWGYGPGRFDVSTVVDRRRKNSAKALFFTGGVDSFLTLRSLHRQLNGLIAIHGFDIWLHDQARFVESSRNIATIANALGLVALYPRTCLRSVQFFEGKPMWGISHLAALSSVAHLFGNKFSHVYVASFRCAAALGFVSSTGSSVVFWAVTTENQVGPRVHGNRKLCDCGLAAGSQVPQGVLGEPFQVAQLRRMREMRSNPSSVLDHWASRQSGNLSARICYRTYRRVTARGVSKPMAGHFRTLHQTQGLERQSDV